MDEVLRGLLCSALRIRPNHPGGIANIQRKNNRGGLSQSGKTNVSKSDQTDLLVPIVSVKLGLFSNLQLNEPKWGTMKFYVDFKEYRMIFLLAGRLNNLRCSRT